MPVFHKDIEDNKWYCDECGEEVAKEVVFAPDIFGNNPDSEHRCRE